MFPRAWDLFKRHWRSVKLVPSKRNCFAKNGWLHKQVFDCPQGLLAQAQSQFSLSLVAVRRPLLLSHCLSVSWSHSRFQSSVGFCAR